MELSSSSRTVRVNGGGIRVIGDFIRNRGTIRANAADYSSAGSISAIAQQELTLEQTSRIEAKGSQVDSRGGDIYLYSHGNAQAKDGQVIDISGGTVSGDGGTGELSAAKRVSIAGSVLGDAHEGYERGMFIVDPEESTVAGAYTANTVIYSRDDIDVIGDVTFDGSLSLFADHKSETAGDWDDGSGAGTVGIGSITRTGVYTVSGSGALSLKAAEDIGSNTEPILTNVGTLDVETRDGYNGSVYITDTGTDGVELTSVDASGGSIDITAESIDITGEVTAGADVSLQADGALYIDKAIEGQSIEVYSGESGTGDLTFKQNVNLDAPTIILGAGDGAGVGTVAKVDLSKAPTISSATEFTLEQDAALDDTEIKNKLFPGNDSEDIDLTLKSYDGTLTLETGGNWESINAFA
jgi:hypothetical protein